MYNYVSVCSGIEAFSVAVSNLDFHAVAFAEIEKFPSAVLSHRYPSIPNLGDMTKIDTAALGQVDWLVGGTPCQSFSFAGLRDGLNDDRGNLTLEFVKLAHKLRDGNGLRGLLWENVPGVLSDKTNAFGCLLGALVGHDGPLATSNGGRWPDLGMVAGPRARCAWRILNSQYFGVPQRRRRVFLVADFGNSLDPAAVLFEPGSQGWGAEACGEAGEDVAGTVSARTKGGGGLGTDMDLAGGLQVYGGNAEGGNAEYPMLTKSNIGKGIHNQAPLVMSFSSNAAASQQFQENIAAPLVKRGDSGHGSGAAIAFDTQQITSKKNRTRAEYGLPASTLSNQSRMHVATTQVRRLTPIECERLQGFPDNWTLIPGLSGWRDVGDDENPDDLVAQGLTVKRSKKGQLRVNDPDGPRYRALGNSFTTEVVNWIMCRAQASLRGERMPDWKPMRKWG